MGEELETLECSVVGVGLHYLWLTQFSWIFVQALNINKVIKNVLLFNV